MEYKKDNIKIGELYLQKGVSRIIRDNGKIVNVNYVNDNLDYVDEFSYIDRSGADDIYQLFENNVNGYIFSQCDSFGNCFRLDSMSIDELNKRFIKLSDFLRDAEFVGRTFRRTQPIYRYHKYKAVYNYNWNYRRGTLISNGDYTPFIDKSYMENYGHSKNIALYMKNNMFLVKYIGHFGNYYKIIDCGYTYDGNYEFLGDVYEEYKDRDKIYSEILMQINNCKLKNDIFETRNCRNTKVRKRTLN